MVLEDYILYAVIIFLIISYIDFAFKNFMVICYKRVVFFSKNRLILKDMIMMLFNCEKCSTLSTSNP